MAEASEEITAAARGGSFSRSSASTRPTRTARRSSSARGTRTTPDSWQTNRDQNGVQVFYFLGKFHDHLAAAPIGFTRAAGNFEAVDGDQCRRENIDGANTDSGLPDGNHVDNANMATPPDGQSPRMQMYLFRIRRSA